ncbi:MAG: DNA replication and repair protein RecF [Muribaculaceae bacterium]|nr:DNA replication and repair protein RecF [Muribaculaceae bacterium]
MILSSLHLTNFKNIGECSLDFSPKINCFLGDNGVGKSNLLDAIHYLSFCKSFAGVGDPMLIRRGEDFAIVRGNYVRRGVEEEVVAGLSAGRRKSFKRSGKEYRRLSEHIGLFPLVMVAPADIELINGSGEVRRRFLDMVISQGDSRYLEALIRYNQALTQRNSMLRDGVNDGNLYLAVEMQMEMAADYIYRVRAERVESLSEIFGRYYSAISATRETPRLIYRSHLSEGRSFQELLDGSREKDRILRHTSVGVHRDDIEMTLDDMPARQTASQGQAKTYTLALRFAQYEFLRYVTSMSPLLLLDDIFDKLDAGRVERIMQIVATDTFGQIFVTDTNRRHLDEIISLTGGGDAIWQVVDGKFTSISHPQQ